MKTKHLAILPLLALGVLLLQGCPAANSPSSPGAPTDTPTITSSPTNTGTPTNSPTATPNVTPVETYNMGYVYALAYVNGTLYGVDSLGVSLVKFTDNGTNIGIAYEVSIPSTSYNVRNMAVTVNGGNVTLFVADQNSKTIRVYADTGSTFTPVTVFGTGFFNINGIGMDGAGNIFAGDTNNGAYRIQYYSYNFSTNTPTLQTPVTTTGFGLQGPGPMALDASNYFYVASLSTFSTALIYKLGPSPTLSAGISFGGAGGISASGDAIKIDPVSGNIFLATGGTDVKKFSPSGTLLYTYTEPDYSSCLAFDGLGHMYVGTVNHIKKINTP